MLIVESSSGGAVWTKISGNAIMYSEIRLMGPRQGVEVGINECPVLQSKVELSDCHLDQVVVVFRLRTGVREQVLSDYWQRGGERNKRHVGH